MDIKRIYNKKLILKYNSSSTVKVSRIYPNNIDLINKFEFKVVKNLDDFYLDYLSKKKNYISKLVKERPDLQVVNLKWRFNDEIIFTQAFFEGNEFLYDDIISNYFILRSSTNISSNKINKSDSNKTSSSNNYDECKDLNPNEYYPISYNDVNQNSLDGYFGGTVATAWAEITVNGTKYLDEYYVCQKVISSYVPYTQSYSSTNGISDAKVEIISSRFFSPYQGDPGHIDYRLAIVLQYKHSWQNVSLTLSYQGGSLTVSGGTGGSKTVEEGAYVTPSILH